MNKEAEESRNEGSMLHRSAVFAKTQKLSRPKKIKMV